MRLQRHQEAIKWGVSAYELAQKGDLDTELAYNCYLWAFNFHTIGDYRMVVQRSQVAERLYLKSGDKSRWAEVAQYRAYALYRLGRVSESDLLFSLIIADCTARIDKVNFAWGNLYRADCRLDRRDTIGLREQILMALGYAQESADTSTMAMANLQLAQLETFAGRYDVAAKAAQTSAAQFHDAVDSIYPLKTCGRALLKLGQVDSAIVQLREAERCLAAARSRYPRSALRRRYLNDKLDLVGDLVLAYVTRGEAAQALHVAEDWKASAFREAIREREDGDDQRTQERIRVNGRLSRLIRGVRLCEYPAIDTSEVMKNIVSMLDSLSDMELLSGPVNMSEFARGDSVSVVELADDRSGVTSLYYFANDKDSSLFVWYAGEYDIEVIDIAAARPNVWGDLVLAREGCRRPPRSQKETDSLNRVLERLADLVPPAIRARLASSKRLIVYPSGVLYYFPFEAIRLGDRYLGEQAPVEYAHSLTTRRAGLRLQKSAQKFERAAIFGGTFAKSTGDPCASTYKGQFGDYVQLAELPSTVGEAEAMEKAFAGRLDSYVDRPDQERRLKQVTPGQYSIIHFATHGLIGQEYSELSGLVLPLDRTTGEDEFLRANELRMLRLDVGLAVLSACHTGEGEMIAGEGVVGLTQSLALAGAGSTVVSLWSVSDRSTTILMKHFYASIAAGKTSVEALFEARKALIHGGIFGHPYFWSSFVSFGDYSPN